MKPVIGTELGPEFDQGIIQSNTVRLKIGSGLSIALDGTISVVNPRQVANGSVPNQDVNDNGVVAITAVVEEGLWTFNPDNSFSYSGSPDHIKIKAHIKHSPVVGNIQRPAPKLVLEQSLNGGTSYDEITSSATGYIRDATGHEESSNTISWRVIAPAANTRFRLSSVQESTNGGVVNSQSGQFDLEAIINP